MHDVNMFRAREELVANWRTIGNNKVNTLLLKHIFSVRCFQFLFSQTGIFPLCCDVGRGVVMPCFAVVGERDYGMDIVL